MNEKLTSENILTSNGINNDSQKKREIGASYFEHAIPRLDKIIELTKLIKIKAEELDKYDRIPEEIDGTEFHGDILKIEGELQDLMKKVYEIKGKMHGKLPAELIENKPNEQI